MGRLPLAISCTTLPRQILLEVAFAPNQILSSLTSIITVSEIAVL